MRHGAAILAAAILAMPARSLATEQEPNRVAFRLEYAPPRTVRGCLNREDFAMWLASRFGYDVVQDDARALVHVEVKPAGRVTEAHVSARDEKGVERWQAVIPTDLDCRELIQDAAASIGANLGNWHLTHEPVPEWLLYRRPEVQTPAPSPRPRPFVALWAPAPRAVWAPSYAKPREDEAAESAATGPRWELGAAFLVAPYGLPAVAYGGGVSVIAKWRFVSAVGELRGLSTPNTTLYARTVRTALWAGLGAICIDPRPWLSLCGTFSGGRLSGHFDRPISNIDLNAISVMVGARFALRLWQPTESIRIRFLADGLIPLGATRTGISTPTRGTYLLAETDVPLVTVGLAGYWQPF